MNPITASNFPGGHALVIAIAAYPKVPPLPAAVVHDAREIAAVLTSPAHCGYLPQNVTQLLDGQATLDAVRRELATLATHTHPQDTVVIFFSGHGARLGVAPAEESALVPFDCTPLDLTATTLSEVEFSAALAAIPAQRLVVLIDACHSAGAGRFKAAAEVPDMDLGFTEKSLVRLAIGRGRVLIASSRASETSLVLGGAKNSLFTEHLVAALRGGAHTQGDGLIRIFDIFNYVAEKVRGAAPGLQHPVFKASDLEDNFPLALDRGGQKTLADQTIGANPSDPWQRLEKVLAELYPTGPQDQEIWARAGGDLSRLRLNGTGRANWFAALKVLRQGGGGDTITRRTLVQAALEEFPHHPDLLGF
ncbi:caspase family protein [Termitidicoccus mucosus]|uniref:Peptidase C14 caspase catalytic subunit p20 n=1 Tax=Termitidicoccus mucosus TaxID=1184151 RepID=A0A178INT2_9BACT|nr:peptidase C14 caspase catalytic subunit p20 [Opitutaceae bacterium TSB47]